MLFLCLVMLIVVAVIVRFWGLIILSSTLFDEFAVVISIGLSLVFLVVCIWSVSNKVFVEVFELVMVILI